MNHSKAMTLCGVSSLIVLLGAQAWGATQRPEPAIEWLVDCPQMPGGAHDQEVLARTQCAIVTVPLNHHAPERGTLDINLTRVGARHPLSRQGVVFTQPGGPQVDSHEVFAVHLATAWKHYGTGAYRTLTNLYDVIELTPRDLLDQTATEQAARDMEFVRVQLGEARINYLGHASGSTLGAWYGALFPQQLQRMVLIRNEPGSHLPPADVARALNRLPDTHRLLLKGEYLQAASANNTSQCLNQWVGDYLAYGKQPPRSTRCVDADVQDNPVKNYSFTTQPH